MFNGAGQLAIIDGKYYIVDEQWECYKECTRNEFIQELNKYAYTCLTSWDKQLRQDYLDLVDYCEEMNK